MPGALLLAIQLLALAGCAAGPDFVRPEPPSATTYGPQERVTATTPDKEGAPRFEQATAPAAGWWHEFGSKQIDAAVSQGIDGNPGLEAAQASLRQSQANLSAGAGIFYPQASATFGQFRGNSATSAAGSSRTANIYNLSTLSASVSYTLDLFGGQRRTVEGLGAQVDYQRAQTLGTYMMLSGNIVNTCIAIAAYRDEIEQSEQLAGIVRQQLDIAEKQYRAGLTTYSSVLAIRNQLTAIDADLLPLRQQESQSEHLLATLVGKSPAEWQTPQLRLADISQPDHLPLSLPSELVRQRPDILAAEAQLHAANAGIGVATAAMFPSFTLTGSYGRSGTELQRLKDGGSGFWGIGANVTEPIFNGGSLRAKRRAAIAVTDQERALYRQTVLSAFAQVADLIRALETDAALTRTQTTATEDAKLGLEIAQANYRAGTAGYVQLLLADTQYRQATIALVQAKARQLQDTTALYVALGGGWKDDAAAKRKAGLGEAK